MPQNVKPQIKVRSIVEPSGEFEAVKDRALDALRGIFPVRGRFRELRLDDVRAVDDKPSTAVYDQLQAKLSGGTWGIPLIGKLSLVDNASGKLIDRREVRLAQLPKLTDRLSYIVDGKEMQVDKQWRLLPGVYTRVQENGELESQFNIKGGERFDVGFDPKTHKFHMELGGSRFPLFPVLKAAGISPTEMRRAWGPEIFLANATEREENTLRKFYRASSRGKELPKGIDLRLYVREFLESKELNPETTKITLGSPVSRADGKSLLLATSSLLGVSRGEREPDDRDSLIFKELHGTEDFIHDKIQIYADAARRRVTNNVDRLENVSEIVYPGFFDKPIKSLFTESVVANLPTQDNPLTFLEGHTKTTVLGPGGISNIQAVTDEAKSVDPSHFAFVDPIHTPLGGDRVGMSTHLALGVSKGGNRVFTPVYDVKAGVMKAIDPTQFYGSYVALPDSVRWEGKGAAARPRPIEKTVRALGPGNRIQEIPFSRVDYVIHRPATLFDTTTNMIPFLSTNSGARMAMADKHLSQAVALRAREPALVENELASGLPASVLPAKLINVYSPADGRVTKIERGSITIEDSKGETHRVEIYDYFPLNDQRAGLHSYPVVKVGDKVSKGDLLADSTFTKGDRLALGTHLRTAMMPIPGLTHEDAFVISESGAKKLTSEHLYKYNYAPPAEGRVGKRAFSSYYPNRYGASQLAKLDDMGFIREGQTVNPGDPLVVALEEQKYTSEAKQLARLKKSLVKPYRDISIVWDREVPGEVVRVHKQPDGSVKVFVRADEPLRVADKISSVFGDKGTISTILPDELMPRDKEGQPVELVVNPQSVAGRLNPGQIYAMAAGKVAMKTGKPFFIKSFEPGVDYGKLVRQELKKHGISDTEELFDPTTGASLGSVMVGPKYVIKHHQQVDRKITSRAGGPGYAYDVDRQPRKGGAQGAQSIGSLGTLALLAHGARNILREAQTLKSDMTQQDELWRSIQLGQPIPPPKPTFAQEKFQKYLEVLGVRLHKDGSRIQMIPLTDKEIIRMSEGEITRPDLTLHARDLVPEKGGLFDPKITGGIDGAKTAHIRLPESMPNPFFERGILALTGLTQAQLIEVLESKRGIDPKTRALTAPKTEGALTGSNAIGHLLRSIDVGEERKKLRQELPKFHGQALDRANRKLRYLDALWAHKLTPDQAYMTSVIPVLPPTMRPLTVLASGDLVTDPLNETYKALGVVAYKMRTMDPGLPERSKGRLRKELYASLGALTGIGAGYKRVQGGDTQGIMDIFTQPVSKHGWIHKRLLRARQDLSARSVITPDPSLTIDEIGIPRRIASEIYQPFVVRELTRAGYTPLRAMDLIKENDPTAEAALRRVMDERPVLMKRDPVLHRYGVQAFKPRLTSGYEIRVPNLVLGGYGGDYDGDTMALYVPVTPGAVKDARKMFPSANLLNPATGKPVYTPSNEMSLGLYRATTIDESMAAKAPEFTTPEEVLRAEAEKKIPPWATVRVGGRLTTSGRIRFWNALPKDMRTDEILFDPKHVMDSGHTNKLLRDLAEKHPQAYARTVGDLVDLGSRNVYEKAFTLSTEDLKADKESRERAFSWANAEIEKLRKKTMTSGERTDKALDVWRRAGEMMDDLHWKKQTVSPTNLGLLPKAGIKPSKDQYKQLLLAPLIMVGPKGKIIPNPITRSYSEGLDVAGYWTQAMAARGTMLRATQEVREPGYLSKQIVNTVADTVVAAEDCGTTSGVSLSVDHPDVLDRYLARSQNGFAHNTLVDEEIVSRLRDSKVSTVVVRSPLTCELPVGICQKCAGTYSGRRPPEIGTNLGVMAGQALGERSTQLLLKAKHTSGVVERGGGAAAVSQLDRVEQLLRLPQKISGAATLSDVAGKVDSIQKDPAGGWSIRVIPSGAKASPVSYHVPAQLGLAPGVRQGTPVRPGEALSGGNVNMHDLLRATGDIRQVQNQIASELDDIYRPQGIRRRNVEIIVRGVTNLGQVMDPGDNDTVRRGDMLPLSSAESWNTRNKKAGRPMRVKPVLKGISHAPLDMTEDWMAKLHHERLKDTIVDAALEGHTANISGYNPFSSLAFNPDFGIGDPTLPGSY